MRARPPLKQPFPGTLGRVGVQSRRSALAIPGILVLAGLLAGCTAPLPRGPSTIGYCPSWIAAPGQGQVLVHVDTGAPVAESFLVPGGADPAPTDNRTGSGWIYHDHPFDMVTVRIVNITSSAQDVALRATSGDSPRRPLQIRDVRTNAGVVVAPLDSHAEGREFNITLTAVTQKDKVHPEPIRLEWSMEWNHNVTYIQQPKVDLHVSVTYWYRVCGL